MRREGVKESETSKRERERDTMDKCGNASGILDLKPCRGVRFAKSK